MHEAIKALEKLQPEFDERYMDSIPPETFHFLFAKILKEILAFKQNPGTRQEAAHLIGMAQRMLEAAGRHHLNNGVIATQKTADRFRDNVNELFKLLNKQGVDEQLVAEADKLDLFRAALDACGIQEDSSPSFGRWVRKPEEKAKGMAYAQENIKEFAVLVHQLGVDGNAVRNRFPSPEEAGWIALFRSVKLLTGEIALIPA